MKVLLIISFFAFISCTIQAQNYEDSLKYYSQNIKDSSSLNKLITYCFTHLETIPDLSFKYSQIAFLKSKEIGSNPCQARSITNLGAIEALRGNYSSALKFYFESLAIWENLKMQRGIMMSKNNIAQVYGYLKKLDLEFQFLKEAEVIANQNNFQDGLGLIKTNLSVYFLNKENFRRAFEEQVAAININLKLNKMALVSIGYSNAGACLFYLKKIDSAILFYTKSKAIAAEIGDKKAIALNFSNIAEAYETKGQTDTAISYYFNAIAISKSNGLKDILSFSYEQLAKIYKKKGDYFKALQFTELKQLMNDSILNVVATKQLAEMQTKYESEKKERTIAEQKFEISKQYNWIIFILTFSILIVLFAFSYYRGKQIKNEIQTQSKLRKSEELAAKEVLDAEERERKRIALDLHDGIGQMMSVAKMNLSAIESELKFINNEQKNRYQKIISLVDESCKEVRMVSHNMMPNALLKSGLANAVKTFLENLDNRIIKINLYFDGLNEKIDSNIETILYRVIQELVNNVIKHAQATQLDISLIKENNFISVSIEDNGIGFNMFQHKNTDGIGLKNIKSRITYLKGTVEWDSKKSKGTVVVINIPC